jgi:hypothetical protein
MDPLIAQQLLTTVQANRNIVGAALTGSQARRRADPHSDIDMLLLASDLDAVRDVRAWLPASWDILFHEFHAAHVCCVLLSGLEKLDLAIFAHDSSSSEWVVHDFEIVKGDEALSDRLAAARTATRGERAQHLKLENSMANLLLLLVSARSRISRGESLSAHAYVAMAADMLASIDRRTHGASADDDLLDVRRRIETTRPVLAKLLHESLFAPPDQGVMRLCEHLSQSCRAAMDAGQTRALEDLLRGDPA